MNQRRTTWSSHNGLDYDTDGKPWTRPVVYDTPTVYTPERRAWLEAFWALTLEQRDAFRDLSAERKAQLDDMTPAQMTAALKDVQP